MQRHDLNKLALPDGTLLEGIVTTVNADGSPNVSPMGPIVDSEFQRLLLRPFQTSTTFGNLRRTGEGVLHVTDDVDLLARAAIGRLDPLPEMRPATAVVGNILTDACRWYAFRVVGVYDHAARAEIVAEVVDHGRHRDFFGFNRAKHAVVEAAILATRIEFLPAEKILAEFRRLASPVDKTGGHQERRAFALLGEFLRDRLGAPQQPGAADQ
jgi:hypothetical protein